MATKQFKIGEYAIGGIIKVDIGNTISIKALDYYSKKVVLENTFAKSDSSYWDINDFLNELTSSYYADMIQNYIIDKATIKHQLFRNY